LCPGSERWFTLNGRLGWVPEPVWMFGEEEKVLPLLFTYKYCANKQFGLTVSIA